MNKAVFLGSMVFLAGVVALHSLGPQIHGLEGDERAAVKDVGSKVYNAAELFLQTLSESQQGQAVTTISAKERHDWHFIPRTRKGLAIKDLAANQKLVLWKLVDASLSEAGSKKTRQVMELEGILRELEGPSRRLARDPGLYHVLVFSRPSLRDKWAWRLEGHIFLCSSLWKEIISCPPPLASTVPTRRSTRGNLERCFAYSLEWRTWRGSWSNRLMNDRRNNVSETRTSRTKFQKLRRLATKGPSRLE